MGVTANEYGVPFWSDENNVELGRVDVCRPCKYNKTHQFEHIGEFGGMRVISQFLKK